MVNSLNKPENKKMRWLLILVSLIILVLGVALLLAAKLADKVLDAVTKSEYQAVFLANGQVYFGKLDAEDGWFVLRDIYYLQVTQELQPASSNSNPDQNPAPSQQQVGDQRVQLVKLGSELHGPEDAMYIPRDKIMFWENLKSDSKVVQTIRQGQ